jgi:hypothetical protein
MNTTSARAHRHPLSEFLLAHSCAKTNDRSRLGSCRTWLECIVATAFILHGASAAATSRRGNDEPPLEAIWRVQTLPFEYHSLNTFYDCDALEQRVRAMLELMGARPPVVVRTNCGRVPAKHINVQIIVATPIPATEENVRAATTFDSKDELIARMNGYSLPTAADIKPFSAQWQRRNVRIAQSDCDLIRGIHEQIVPKLSVRSVSKKVSCPRISSLRTRMQYEALIALPEPTQFAAPRS